MPEPSTPNETSARSDIQLLLDSDVVEYFEGVDNSEDVINDILRIYVEDEKKRS